MWRELCHVLIPLYVTFLSASELGLTNPFVCLPRATGGTHSISAVFFLGGGTHFLVLCCGRETFQMWSVVVISLSLQKAPVPSHSRVTWWLPWPFPAAARFPVNSCENNKNCVNTVLLLWGKAKPLPLRRMTDVKLGKGKSRRSFALLQWGYVTAKRASYFQQLAREGWMRRVYEMWIYNRRLRTHLEPLNKIQGYQPGKSQSSWCRWAIPCLSSQHCPAIRFSPLTYLHLLYNISSCDLCNLTFKSLGGWRAGRIESVLCLCCCFKSSRGR